MATTVSEMRRLTECAPGERLLDVRRGPPQVLSENLVGNHPYPGRHGPASFNPDPYWYAPGNERGPIVDYTGAGYATGADIKQLYWNSALYKQPSEVDGHEHLVGVHFDDYHVMSEHVTDQYNQYVHAVKPTYLLEKVVEQPVTIVKERVREVRKPEIIERVVHQPKIETREILRTLPPAVVHQEQIVEVPQVAVEERVLHKPRHVVQERLIEVPKYEFVEKIEYIDYVEYREVPVDKIVEIPEIEYRVREVEKYVPQTFVQEYYVDNYVEQPITQVQEVERRERIPLPTPPCDCDVLMQEIAEGNAARARCEAELAMLRKEVASMRVGKTTTVVASPPTPVVFTPPQTVRQVVQPQVQYYAAAQPVVYAPPPPVPTPPGSFRVVAAQAKAAPRHEVVQTQMLYAVPQVASETLVYAPQAPAPTPPGSVRLTAAPAAAMAAPPGSMICSRPGTPPLTYAAPAAPPSPPATSPTAMRVQGSVAACAPAFFQSSQQLTSAYSSYEPRTPLFATVQPQTAGMAFPSEPTSVGGLQATRGSAVPASSVSLFDAIDRNHDGVITREEFERTMAAAAPPGSMRPATPPPRSPQGSTVFLPASSLSPAAPPASGGCTGMQYVGSTRIDGSSRQMQYVGTTRANP